MHAGYQPPTGEVIPPGTLIGNPLTWNEASPGAWAESGIAPLYVPVMDWTAFIALVNAQAALGRAVQMGPGTWTADAAILLADNATIYGGPNVVILGALPLGLGPTNAVFMSQGITSPASTNLSANAAAGARIINVNALVLGVDTITVGGTIVVSGIADVWKVGVYTVTAIAGAGPFALTLDRPLFVPFTAADQVKVVRSRPDGIHIDGRGMLMSGTCNRYIEIAMGANCLVENIRLDGSLGDSEPNDYLAAFDVGGFNNTFRGMRCDGNGFNSGACLALESNETSSVVDCQVANNLSTGVLLLDCWDCKVLDTQAYNCDTYGFRVGRETIGGCVSTTLRGCTAGSCGTIVGTPQGGIVVEGASSDTIIDDCTTLGCGNAVGLSAGILLMGTSTRTVISKCRANNGAVFAGINIGEATVTKTTVRDVVLDGNLVGFVSYGGDYTLDGFVITNSSAGAATPGALGVSNSAVVTDCRIANGFISVPNGNGTYGIAWAGANAAARMNVDNVHIELSGAGVRVALYHATGVCRVSNVLVDGAGAAANFGLYAAGGTIRLGDGIDVGACGTPLTGITSIGNLVSGGAGAPQAVAWPDIEPTDHVTWTRTVNGGVPGIAPLSVNTVGVGFAATFAAGDTSTYQWRVE